LATEEDCHGDRHDDSRRERLQHNEYSLATSGAASSSVERWSIRCRDVLIALAERGEHHSRVGARLEIAQPGQGERKDEKSVPNSASTYVVHRRRRDCTNE
jgi:hypothetical protein